MSRALCLALARTNIGLAAASNGAVDLPAFDEAFLRLPDATCRRIEAVLDDTVLRLGSYPHYRMTSGNRYRLRVRDYRIICTFDIARNEIHLLAVGHRREVDRQAHPPRLCRDLATDDRRELRTNPGRAAARSGTT